MININDKYQYYSDKYQMMTSRLQKHHGYSVKKYDDGVGSQMRRESYADGFFTRVIHWFL